jgi:hypothetical protein
MSQHKQIVEELERQYELLRDAILVGPKALAYKVYKHFEQGRVEAHIQYASLEHLTNMARKFLAKKAEPDSDDNDVYGDQGVLFSGQLQDRYPIPRKPGEEPLYKKRAELTAEERAWNVEILRKSARSREEHADALEAEGLARDAA